MAKCGRAGHRRNVRRSSAARIHRSGRVDVARVPAPNGKPLACTLGRPKSIDGKDIPSNRCIRSVRHIGCWLVLPAIAEGLGDLQGDPCHTCAQHRKHGHHETYGARTRRRSQPREDLGRRAASNNVRAASNHSGAARSREGALRGL